MSDNQVSNFVRYRWWWLGGAVACLLWIAIIESSRPSADTCKFIQDIEGSGNGGPGCGTPPQLPWAVAGAVVFGLMFLIATLARKREDSTGTGDRK